MEPFTLEALSPLDGRYAGRVGALRPLMSEAAFMKHRVVVEIAWLNALSDAGLPELPPFSPEARAFLRRLVDGFGTPQAARIKEIERKTNHDVKAVEYFLKESVQDVPELLRVLDFTPVSDVRVVTRCEGPETLYQTPTAEFAASVLSLDGGHLGHEVDAPSRHAGPQILVCTRGAVTVRAKSGQVHLHRGAAAWVAADDGPIRLQADEPSAVFRATVGL